MSYYSGSKLLHVCNGIDVLQVVWVPDGSAIFKFGQDSCVIDLVADQVRGLVELPMNQAKMLFSFPTTQCNVLRPGQVG